MKPVPVIAIFDIGRTNKKLFLFDEQYNIVFERSTTLDDIKDEDGDACENIDALRSFLSDSLNEILNKKKFFVKAINYSAYGASFVYIDENGNAIAPLYSYLKKYPEHLHKKFYSTYGGEVEFSHRTASPVLGNLNSGLQLYRIEYEKPEIFQRIDCALHLPQYISFLITQKKVSDITSIGCHTGLWDFTKNNYHDWVIKERVEKKLTPLFPLTETINVSYKGHDLISGIGIHDSSAALIPYLLNFKEPFVLISTGTWNITLNPFNQIPLTTTELRNDCLCYLSYKGTPVKAARFFAGHEHDEQVKILSTLFNKPMDFYKSIKFDLSIVKNFSGTEKFLSGYPEFENYEEAYHYLITQLIKRQSFSSEFVMTKNIKRIFVDGGFSNNPIFMNLLASLYQDKEVYAATIAQSTALGAALAIHNKWNPLPVSENIIVLKRYLRGHS